MTYYFFQVTLIDSNIAIRSHITNDSPCENSYSAPNTFAINKTAYMAIGDNIKLARYLSIVHFRFIKIKNVKEYI